MIAGNYAWAAVTPLPPADVHRKELGHRGSGGLPQQLRQLRYFRRNPPRLPDLTLIKVLIDLCGLIALLSAFEAFTARYLQDYGNIHDVRVAHCNR